VNNVIVLLQEQNTLTTPQLQCPLLIIIQGFGSGREMKAF